MKRRQTTTYVMTAGMIAAMALAGCGTKNNTKKETEDRKQAKVTASADTDQGNSAYIEKLTSADYSNFKPLNEYKADVAFQNTIDKEKLEQPFEMKAEYDLNQDGTTDQITFSCNRDKEEAVLKINDAELDVSCPSPTDAYLIDLDTRDSYMNVVLYDEGMSADPCYHFYQYDGTEIKPLGALGCFFEGTIGFDGFNRAAQQDSFLNDLDAPILTGYFELKDTEWKTVDFDLSDVSGKEYTIGKDCDGFFSETDQSVDDFEPTWSEDDMVKLHAGDKITINKIGEYERYEVKMPDGKTGILYFWIGD